MKREREREGERTGEDEKRRKKSEGKEKYVDTKVEIRRWARYKKRNDGKTVKENWYIKDRVKINRIRLEIDRER